MCNCIVIVCASGASTALLLYVLQERQDSFKEAREQCHRRDQRYHGCTSQVSQMLKEGKEESELGAQVLLIAHSMSL